MTRVSRLLAVLVLVLITVAAACAGGPRVTLTAPDGTTRVAVNVEIANTPAARELGLMYRAHLDPDAGMIFVFPAPARLTFWMKNTSIPLDMIFADGAGKVVGLVEDAAPFSEQTLGVGADARYVLEVNGGFAQRYHVASGDRLTFSGFVPNAPN